MRNIVLLDYRDGEPVVLQFSAWTLWHPGCSMMSRKREESDSGKIVTGNVRSSYCNVLGIFLSLDPTHMDSETQGEGGPRSRGTEGESCAHNWVGTTLAFSRVPAD